MSSEVTSSKKIELSITQRINKILDVLNEGIHERDEILAVSLLSALSDQNIFLLGPPGTAKSLISRRLSHVFESKSYFEYLMQRFSTPEEVFGPVSISELKKDNYKRKTHGFLPKADFAFLDEIWKSSPAILNTLLTVINEKVFRNGVNIETVPLKVLISASNETPPPNQGLEALYDRFLVRLFVPPMRNKDNFNELLQTKPTASSVNIEDHLKITHIEWEEWASKINDVNLSEDTLNVIHGIRLALKESKDDLSVYVSDRRWQRAAMLLKASAFFCGREETNIIDTLLLRHCLWTNESNRKRVIEIVESVVLNNGFCMELDIESLDLSKEQLEQEIKKELLYNTDQYETVTHDDNKEYFRVESKYKNNEKDATYYIDLEYMKTNDDFHPIDSQGNEISWISCNFDNQGSCNVSICDDHDNRDPYTKLTFKPTVLFYKGERKKDVNKRLIEALKDSVSTISSKITSMITDIDNRLSVLQQEQYSPFVPEKVRNIALQSIFKQQEEMELRFKDCERLSDIIG